jgi:hypothetical protein
LLSGRRSKPQRERERLEKKYILLSLLINGFGVGGQDRLK